jgi:hypothetical protein
MKLLLLYRKTFAILILYVGISHLIKTAIRWNEIAPCDDLKEYLNDRFRNLSGKEGVFVALEGEITRFEKQNLDEEYCSEVFRNIDKKRSLERGGYVITADKLIRHTIQYSGFKIDTYLSSGVAPKQYFGFLDEIGDTAYYERILRQTVIDVVRITNDYAQRSELKTRISEKEIIVTFLAEGGALLLTTPELSPDKVHPVRGIGLDDLKSGLNKYPSLIDEYDRFFGSKLKDFLLFQIAGRAVVTRPMTFKESILGTALMYLYEKEITAEKMNDEWHEDLMTLPLSQQFISTSLVYNSGILFSKERVEQIEQFATGDYLAKINQESNRKKLPIYTPEVALQRLKNGEQIPQQLTSWNAVYHVLQRYGAWVAIERFAGVLSFLLTCIMLNLQI